MAAEESGAQDVTASAMPPLTCSATLHWDGMGALYRDVGLQNVAEQPQLSCLQAQGQPTPGHQAPPPVTPRPLCLIPSTPPHAIDCDTAAACLTFCLDTGLLLAPVSDMLRRATGELVWVRREGAVEGITAAEHPMLLVQAVAAFSPDHVELVPHLCAHDPLRYHSVLVLQAARAADSVAGRLYAEILANALAVHFLRRYAACTPPGREVSSGLSPAKLQRTIAYIQAHLAQELSLTTLAAVVHLSPDHFARLFRQATGRTPHQYVLWCRIERAKQLLAETDVPLSAMGLQVGCTDQSHFTALFRRHVGTTPKTYRDATQKA